MMSIGAGLAACGHQVWVSTFAAFASLLCAEHLRTDMAYPQLPVRVLAHHAGISMGFYGTSHHATEDIAVTRAIAGLTVLAPCDGPSLRACVRATLEIDGPVYLRVGRGNEPDVHEQHVEVIPGRFIQVVDGADVTVIATGIGVTAAVGASAALAAEGIGVRVLDAISLKPFDSEAVVDAARDMHRILVVEEHNVVGGLATAVSDTLALAGASSRIERLGLNDEYALVAPPTHLYRHYGFTVDGVIDRLRGLMQ
jgi:transketolase